MLSLLLFLLLFLLLCLNFNLRQLPRLPLSFSFFQLVVVVVVACPTCVVVIDLSLMGGYGSALVAANSKGNGRMMCGNGEIGTLWNIAAAPKILLTFVCHNAASALTYAHAYIRRLARQFILSGHLYGRPSLLLGGVAHKFRLALKQFGHENNLHMETWTGVSNVANWKSSSSFYSCILGHSKRFNYEAATVCRCYCYCYCCWLFFVRVFIFFLFFYFLLLFAFVLGAAFSYSWLFFYYLCALSTLCQFLHAHFIQIFNLIHNQ